MNVWGSGGAHNTYFKKVDEIIVEIFNRPLINSPKASAIWVVATARCSSILLRRQEPDPPRIRLEQHPLMMVGVDFNKVARRITKQKLRKAGIPNHL